MNFFQTLIITALLAICSLLFGSWYTIDEGERGVILRNGKIIGTAEPGLGFKIPLFDSVEKISIQTYTSSFKGVDAYSRDQQPATVAVSVTYSVPPSKVLEVYSEFQSIERMVDRLLDRQVPTQVENVFGRYTAINAVQERVKFGADLSAAIKNSISGPLEIQSVQLENVAFSSAYERTVEDRMKAEVEVQTQAQNLEKEKVNASITVTKAKAEADSILALAQSEAQSILLKGEAEAKAIKFRADALAANENLVELTKAEKWNGVLPTHMLPNTTLPFLELTKSSTK